MIPVPARTVGACDRTVRGWVAQEARERSRLARGRGAPDGGGDLRYRYSAEQVKRARTLVAQGQTIAAAAIAVDVPRQTVGRWVKQAA